LNIPIGGWLFSFFLEQRVNKIAASGILVEKESYTRRIRGAMPVSSESNFLVSLTETVQTENCAPPASLAQEVVSLFDQFRAPLLRYLLALGLPMEDGEEVIQEVFLGLFQHLQRGRPRTNLHGWLFRVAHNLGLKRRCRVRRDMQTEALDLFVDPAPNPEDRMASSQQHQRLLAVLGALPERDRRCLSLRAEGLRYREIAGVLDISLGAVSLSLGRSLVRIARAIGR
jgi:RNA polymerase sigma-70 factor, ECF subfamily